MPGEPLGTVRAYVTPVELKDGGALAGLRRQLAAAAAALGIRRAICMVDMVMRDGQFVMIELAPRLAGDCLPALTRDSTGLDVFAFALAFALGELPAIPPAKPEPRVAVRFLAADEGVITRLDTTALEADPRVLQIDILRGVGEEVVLPPANYDMRLLGYAIFMPSDGVSIEQQCAELEDALEVRIEPLASGAKTAAGGGSLPASMRM
jgi:biotin carboxylase